MARSIQTFDEFIDAAIEHLGAGLTAGHDEPAFINGEALPAALRRWWGDVMQLQVVAPNTYRWTCMGCALAAESVSPLYQLPLFDYLLWDFCPHCRRAMTGEESQAGT